MNICIIGGGNLGHVCAGFLAAQPGTTVTMLSGRPAEWGETIAVADPDGCTLHGRLAAVSNDAATLVPRADLVLLCLPGFALPETLRRIAPYLAESTAVGSVVSSTGFFFFADELLPPATPLFGFQRVPFIARTTRYGHSADLKGYKPQLHLATRHAAQPETLRATLETLFRTPVGLLGSWYEAALTNSNPLLHPARLYDLWHNWHEGETTPRPPLFYEEWTDAAARLYIGMDEEFQQLLRRLGVAPSAVPPVTDYYDSPTPAALAAKLRAIPAFKGIEAPVRNVAPAGTPPRYAPDFGSRYFTEDFPYGLRFVCETAARHNVSTPLLDRVYRWGTACLAR
ncbi:MAG: NAD/NADP octopine/nopaline dehydrogenase family protein [Bacteroidaceae bacterium]|nr:NAD/NADP octopine/nopaline dehydrogenase family protein [Bacteroidaceae bacterium]